MNGFRHELVALFGAHLSQGKIPDGLLKGIGGYGEDPADVFEDWYQMAGSITEPDLNWQSLWDGGDLLSDESALLQMTSIVAYLVDVYGWNSFVDFLRYLANTEGYHQALLDSYDLGIQPLQSHWRKYFTVYVSDRWHFNVFHNYELGVFEELIAAGAYSDAATGLQEAIPMIEIFGNEGDLVLAHELLASSKLGVQAGSLVGEARQAFIAGDYQHCIEVSNQALEIYHQLGDKRRKGEIEVYLAVAQEVLSLRNEVEEIGLDIPYPDQVKRLIEIGHRLSELGDGQGFTATEVALVIITSGQRKLINLLSALGGVLILFLLIRRVIAIRRPQPPEADLL
jgi:hypothetical protein